MTEEKPKKSTIRAGVDVISDFNKLKKDVGPGKKETSEQLLKRLMKNQKPVSNRSFSQG